MLGGVPRNLGGVPRILEGVPRILGGVSRNLEKLGGVPRILVDINYSSLFLAVQNSSIGDLVAH